MSRSRQQAARQRGLTPALGPSYPKGVKLEVPLVVATATLAAACGPKVLRPKPTPTKQRIVAEAPTPAPPAGHGRIYIDTVDGSARVGKILEVIETEVEAQY